MESIQWFLEFAFKLFAEHPRWWLVVLVMTVVGDFAGRKVWTLRRAYDKTLTQPMRRFFFVMREYICFHSMAVGLLLGAVWTDPNNTGTPDRADAILAFIGAGALSEAIRIAFKAVAKARAWKLDMPGDSEPPAGFPHLTDAELEHVLADFKAPVEEWPSRTELRAIPEDALIAAEATKPRGRPRPPAALPPAALPPRLRCLRQGRPVHPWRRKEVMIMLVLMARQWLLSLQSSLRAAYGWVSRNIGWVILVILGAYTGARLLRSSSSAVATVKEAKKVQEAKTAIRVLERERAAVVARDAELAHTDASLVLEVSKINQRIQAREAEIAELHTGRSAATLSDAALERALRQAGL